jgi:hypothetical protein
MKRAFNQLNEIENILALAFRRNAWPAFAGVAGGPALDATFNDGEDEEGPGLAFRGAVGFVTNRFNAVMTLFTRREECRYREWEKEARAREKKIWAALEDLPAPCAIQE